MADQCSEEIHHHPCNPGHLHQQPEDDKHRHGEQEKVRDTVVDPVDNDNERQVGGQRQIRKGRNSKSKSNWYANQNASRHEHDKEQNQVAVPHRNQQRLRQPQRQRNRPNDHDSKQAAPRVRCLEQSQQRDGGGKGSADQDGDNAVTIGDRERDKLGRSLDLEILRCRKQDFENKDNQNKRPNGPEEASPFGPDRIHKRRQPHVLVAAQCHDRSQHRQPKEQEVGEFVGPHQRAVEGIARNDTGKENAGLGQHQCSANAFR